MPAYATGGSCPTPAKAASGIAGAMALALLEALALCLSPPCIPGVPRPRTLPAPCLCCPQLSLIFSAEVRHPSSLYEQHCVRPWFVECSTLLAYRYRHTVGNAMAAQRAVAVGCIM